MRVQISPSSAKGLMPEKVSISSMIKYYSESYTGFPGGRTFYYYSSATLQSRYVSHTA